MLLSGTLSQNIDGGFQKLAKFSKILINIGRLYEILTEILKILNRHKYFKIFTEKFTRWE